MTSLALVAFVAGMLTILAPCVLPVLPVILAWSVGEANKWHPYVVTLSLAVSIVLFTAILKASTALLGIPPDVWKYLSGLIVLFLGLTYLFPHAWSRISSRAGSSKSRLYLERAGNVRSGTLRAVLTGASLGPVFSSCSPTYSLLLATVFPVSFLQGMAYTFVYALGLSAMLLAISLWGRKLIARIRPLADESGAFRRALGIVLVVVALALFTGADKRAEAYLIGKSDIGSFEQNLLEMGIPIRATDARTSESAKKHLDAPVTTRKETGYLGYSESLAGSARKSGQKILVVFHADWCPSCKALETDIRANLASIPPDVLILKADFDAGTELRQKYGVTVQSTAISLNPDGSLAKKELCGTSLKALIQRFFPYP